MANEYGLFFDSVNGDRVYNSDSFAEWLRKFFTTGVFNGDLQVQPSSGMSVTVGTGYANIEGRVRFFDTTQTKTLPVANGTYPRIDTIVVRLDLGNRQITCETVQGTYSGNNPSPTAPVREDGIYEIVLAQIYVGAGVTEITTANITDTRADDTLCGWVTSTVESVPVEQLVAQMQDEFNIWFDHMKDQLSEDAAGHLQQEIDTITGAISSINTEIGDADISEIGDGTLKGATSALEQGLETANTDIGSLNTSVSNLNTSVSRIRSVATLLTQRLIPTSNTKYTLNESVSNFALVAVVCGWGNNNVLDTVVMPSAVWSSNKTDSMRLWVNRQPSANLYVDVKSRTATTLYCQSNNSNVSVGVYGILRVN